MAEQQTPTVIAPEPHAPIAVVGLGASAGGLEALRAVLKRLPVDTGAAFIVVQHVDPLHESALTELLGRCTSMPVVTAADGSQLAPNHVYVTPPNVTLTVRGNALHTEPPREARGLRLPIDALFNSLGGECGWRAVAIVLSGSGADGTVGLRAVKEAGGLVIAQDPSTAQYEAMPRNALATGMVDHILPPERVPDALVEYLHHLHALSDPGGEPASAEAWDYLRDICAAVEQHTGHDFSRYKRSTLVRRIQRRMRVIHVGSVPEYLVRLRASADEGQALLRDLLIGVTQFFRDPEAFEGLSREVLVPLVRRNAHPIGQIRAWVPACATGEEAFTLAMLMREACQEHPIPPQITIFATDIDRHALNVARSGRYPEGVAAQISPERLQAHFTHEDGYFQVSKTLREMCIFSLHNVLADPPFARLNLISCRNLFIFLEPELQRKLIPLFHYTLRPGGYLFLGPSENLVGGEDLFRVVNKKLRIFQAIDAPLRAAPELPLGRNRRAVDQNEASFRQPPRRDRDVRALLERALLETHAPPGVVVDTDNKVAYFSGRTGRYLEQPGGLPTADLVEIVRPELRLALRTALHKARKGAGEVVHEGLAVTVNGMAQELDLVVRPLGDEEEMRGMLLVVFRERGAPKPAGEMPRQPAAPDTEAVARLESELRTMREHLESAVEELEGSNHELRISNEELLSLNEELQSANEEMQTSKEELQSMNEELETVNTELRNKVEELDAASSDLQNFFQSAEIAMIFLDREMRIKRFTPATRALFRVVGTDLNRPITDLAPRFGDGNLVHDIQEVLSTLRMCEHEVQLGEGGAQFLLRILPYKTVDNVIAGVVLTFFDITELKSAQAERLQLAALVQNAQDAIIGARLDGKITAWNEGAERTYGYTAAEILGCPMTKFVPPDLLEENDRVWQEVAQGGRPAPFDTYRLHKDGRRIPVQLALSHVLDSEGKVVGICGAARDISALRRVESELRAARDELEVRVRIRTSELEESNVKLMKEVRERRLAVRARDKDRRLLNSILEQAADGIVATDVRGDILFVNEAARRVFGFVEGSVPTRIDDAAWGAWLLPDGSQMATAERPVVRAITGVSEVGKQVHVQRPDGTELDALVSAAPVRADGGAVTGAVAVIVDVTTRLREEAVARRTAEEYRVMFEMANVGKARLSRTNGIVERANHKLCEMLGRTAEELACLSLVDLVHADDREGFATALARLARVEIDEYTAEIRFTRPDGAPMWVQASLAPCFVAGEASWFAGVFVDVTDRWLLQGELEQARKLEGIGRLAGGIAHDFNNILTAIVGFTDVTLRLVGDPRARSNLEQIRIASGRASELTARLLAFARKQVIEPRVVDANETATRTEQLLRRIIGPDIDVRLSLARERLLVRIDPGQLEQALLNLALNARDAMPDGGRLTLATERREVTTTGGSRAHAELADGTYVVLRVQDTGVGMTPEQVRRCFEPFYTTKEIGKGTGLGLATVYGVVRQAGGHVTVQSAPGHGSTFCVFLPRASSAEVGEGTIEVLALPRGGDETVLVVEDEPMLLTLAREALTALGYRVLVAPDGREALGVLDQHEGSVDAVITDILMPKMGGRELAEQLHVRWPEIPVLYVSGYSEGTIGDAAFLEKPYTPEALARKLRELLDATRPPDA
ncbi:MAG: PAS domain S-box protein [Pseudomonadota bacterium]|nr:PAS domain S-box protein [Pseudomonadota bacterium]